MKRSELERDARALFESVKSNDYDIPTNSAVMKVILKKLLVVVFIQLLMIGVDSIYYDSEWRGVIAVSIVSAGVNLLFAFIFIVSLYQLVSMSLSISEEMKQRSLIVRLLTKRMRSYWRGLIAVNTSVGLVLVLCGDGFVMGLGASWFATFMLSMIFIQVSLTRYMTPVVINVLSGIKEQLSGGAVKNEDMSQ